MKQNLIPNFRTIVDVTSIKLQLKLNTSLAGKHIGQPEKCFLKEESYVVKVADESFFFFPTIAA
jgi:hypothetical protein